MRALALQSTSGISLRKTSKGIAPHVPPYSLPRIVTREPNQSKAACACGGGCGRCQEQSPLREQRQSYQPEPIDLCIGATGPASCEFTDRQGRVLNAVRYDARSVTARALSALSREDPYMSTLARRIFQVPSIDMESVADTVAGVLDKLRNIPFSCGSCTDATCTAAGTVAYTMSDLSSVVICQPRFFAQNLVQQRRTMIHECAHAFGIDATRASLGQSESYCREDSGVECADPCGNLTGDLRQNVDAWARFIECAAFRS